MKTRIFKIKDNKIYTGFGQAKLSPVDFEVLAEYKEGGEYAWIRNKDGFFHMDNGKFTKTKTDILIPINKDYAKNRKSVFCRGVELPGSHPESFVDLRAINPDVYYFAFDKNQVYADSGSGEGIQILEDVDTQTLIFLNKESYFADKNRLYYFNWHFFEFMNYNKPMFFNDLEVVNLNRTSNPEKGTTGEVTIKHFLKSVYPHEDAWWNWNDEYFRNLKLIAQNIFTDGHRVFYYLNKEDFDYPYKFYKSELPYYSVIPEADISTFKVLDKYYSLDSKNVYHISRLLMGADKATFKSLGSHFASDKNGIWYNGYLCKEADSESFQIIAFSGIINYSKDKNNILSTQYGKRIGKFKGYSTLLVPLGNSDPESFVIINDIWAKDRNNVYCSGTTWKNIDSATFAFLFEEHSNSWARCKNGLYNANGRTTIKGVDGNSFKMLNEFWGKDENVVFSFKTERIIKDADPKTFESTDDLGGARDKNYAYSITENGSIKRK